MTDTPTATDPNDVAPAIDNLETIVSLSKRRGFVYPSSEIYGGINAVWDYGPLGVELKNNVKRAWWRAMVQERTDIVGLDAGILMHPKVWVTSGHVGSFSDPLVECATCHRRYRLDELPSAENLTATDLTDPTVIERFKLVCPNDGGPLSPPRRFNLMFQTYMGPVQDESSIIYLRPETAQGSYVNFKNVQQSSRKKIPFGIAQVGKSFRNEISPGNFVFRMREFEQMEMQYFVRPEAEAAAAFEMWLPKRRAWYEKYGVTSERLRLRESHLRVREHGPEERSHYSLATSDIEYLYPIGWSELEGVANRGDYDLRQHTEASGTKLEYVDPDGSRYMPFVIEPAVSIDRIMLALLVDAYDEEVVEERERTLLRFHPAVAPVKAAILPLISKEQAGMVEPARKLYEELRRHHLVEYDDAGNIGRRYRRQDEIGTPWAFTIDEVTLEDGTVTVRDRDSLAQERLPLEGVRAWLDDALDRPWSRPPA